MKQKKNPSIGESIFEMVMRSVRPNDKSARILELKKTIQMKF